MPGNMPYSKLDFHYSPPLPATDSRLTPKWFGWLTGQSLVFHCNI